MPPSRRQLGAWYTPPPLVDHVMSMALAARGRSTTTGNEITVLDPACGDGAFLSGARRHLGASAQLSGCDIDPAAASRARAAVPGARIDNGDALALDWSDRRFDLVVGNPPFLNQLARATSRGGRSRFGGGPYADAAAEFLALAARMARPDGGVVALVLPHSVLSTRDAAAIRADVAERSAIVHAWWSVHHEFDAAVHTCALVLRMGSRQGAVTRTFGLPPQRRPPVSATTVQRSWAALLGDGQPPDTTRGPTLGSIASFSIDFRDQYYGLIGAVDDAACGPPLVTSGLIDPGVCHWGRRPARFAKRTYAAPRVALDALSPPLQRWARARLVPKLLIANQTRVIEAVADHEGAWLPSVPTLTCTSDHLDRVESILARPTSTAWVHHHAAGSGLSPTTVRLTPALLASIPLPND